MAASPAGVRFCSVSNVICAVLMAKRRSCPIGTGFWRPNSVSRMPTNSIPCAECTIASSHEPGHAARDYSSRPRAPPSGFLPIHTVRQHVSAATGDLQLLQLLGLLHLLLHRLESLYTLVNGRVRREEDSQRVAAQRRHDEERVDRLRRAEILLWNACILHRVTDAQQRRGQIG